MTNQDFTDKVRQQGGTSKETIMYNTQCYNTLITKRSPKKDTHPDTHTHTLSQTNIDSVDVYTPPPPQPTTAEPRDRQQGSLRDS